MFALVELNFSLSYVKIMLLLIWLELFISLSQVPDGIIYEVCVQLLRVVRVLAL